MSDFTVPGLIPELPRTLGAFVEYHGKADKWRIAKTGETIWTVHRANDHSYQGTLVGAGTGFSYSYKGADHGSGNATFISYGELFSIYLG
jgi:hypothetical protein